MSEGIDRAVYLNVSFDPAFATFDDCTRPGRGDELAQDREYHAVAVRETAHDGLIQTSEGTRAVVWDRGIETDRGVLWLPVTMLHPPYSDI